MGGDAGFKVIQIGGATRRVEFGPDCRYVVFQVMPRPVGRVDGVLRLKILLMLGSDDVAEGGKFDVGPLLAQLFVLGVEGDVAAQIYQRPDIEDLGRQGAAERCLLRDKAQVAEREGDGRDGSGDGQGSWADIGWPLPAEMPSFEQQGDSQADRIGRKPQQRGCR